MPATTLPPIEATASRPLAVRMRPDLTAHRLTFSGRTYWTVKDAVGLRYVQLSEEEYAVLEMLDGSTSLKEIQRTFARRFAPQALTLAGLQDFIGRLDRQGLLVSESPGQGQRLLERHRRQRNKQHAMMWTRLLAIRFRGIDLDGLIGWLAMRLSWMFSTWFLAVFVLLLAYATLVVTSHWSELIDALPAIGSLATGPMLLGLMAALAISKILHELGHGIACKHFGGECHEMGLMLLVLTPCLYCDVSDSWTLSDKWRRIAISAAGIVVELGVAAVATILWWHTEPGWLNTLCMNLMFVCSVSTLISNGNPLLRYDGYYVLADFAEVPNLWQRSREEVRRWLSRVMLGMELPEDPAAPSDRRGFLVVYGIASMAYRVFVLLLIFWFLHNLLKPYQLTVLANLVMLTVLASMLIPPVSAASRFLRSPLQRRKLRPGRAVIGCLVALGLVAALLLVPIPHRVSAPLVLRPEVAEAVYVTVPGELEWAAAPGTEVSKDAPLAKLENHERQLELRRLQDELEAQTDRVDTLMSRRGSDPEAAAVLPTARETLADLQKRVDKQQTELERLTIQAPFDGIVLAPRPREQTTEVELPEWIGSPLDDANRNAWLTAGTVICRVAKANQLESVLDVDERNIELVRRGQIVRLTFDQRPGEVYRGEVVEVAEINRPSDAEQSSEEEKAAEAIEESQYLVRVSIDGERPDLLPGGKGNARISTGSRSLAWRLSRFVRRTFRLHW